MVSQHTDGGAVSMNLIDEHTSVIDSCMKTQDILMAKKQLRDASIKELQSFTPVYKDFPVLVARAKQLQKDIKDCDVVIPQLESDINTLTQKANVLYKIIKDQYELRMDYTTGNKVWTEPGTYERMMIDALNTGNMSIDEIKVKCDNMEMVIYQCRKSSLGTHVHIKWRYLGQHDCWNVMNKLKVVIDAKQSKVAKKSKWFI